MFWYPRNILAPISLSKDCRFSSALGAISLVDVSEPVKSTVLKKHNLFLVSFCFRGEIHFHRWISAHHGYLLLVVCYCIQWIIMVGDVIMSQSHILSRLLGDCGELSNDATIQGARMSKAYNEQCTTTSGSTQNCGVLIEDLATYILSCY